MRHEARGAPRWLVAAFVRGALPARAGADPPRFGAGTDIVVLSAVAVDKKGRPVPDLRSDEFRVFEDGRPRPLQQFSRGSSVPARLLVLVDASGSMSQEVKTTSARMAIVQLLAALRPQDEVAMAGFDDRYFGLVPFTRDHAAIDKAFAGIEPWGSTALHDALDRAAHDLASQGEGRRAVIVITDGIDNASQTRADDVIARSRALDVPIYTLSVMSAVDDPGSDRFGGDERPGPATDGSKVLARYAEMSGGAAFVVSDFAALKKAADTIVAELAHQYRLGYEPPEGPSRFRRVEVRATRKGVVVRTRSGYVPRR